MPIDRGDICVNLIAQLSGDIRKGVSLRIKRDETRAHGLLITHIDGIGAARYYEFVFD